MKNLVNFQELFSQIIPSVKYFGLLSFHDVYYDMLLNALNQRPETAPQTSTKADSSTERCGTQPT